MVWMIHYITLHASCHVFSFFSLISFSHYYAFSSLLITLTTITASLLFIDYLLIIAHYTPALPAMLSFLHMKEAERLQSMYICCHAMHVLLCTYMVKAAAVQCYKHAAEHEGYVMSREEECKRRHAIHGEEKEACHECPAVSIVVEVEW